MPLMAPSVSLARWVGSTYWFSTMTRTRASWSSVEYGLDACVVAWAKCEVAAPPANAAATSSAVRGHPDRGFIARR